MLAAVRNATALLALGCLAAGGCAPRPLLERVVRARGGAVRSFVRVADAEVQAGFPGAWQWETAFLAPDRYAWSIVTAAGVDHYLFDGTAVLAFVGGNQVARDAAPTAPLRSHARFVAVTTLAGFPGATVAALPPSDLPPGVVAGVSVVLPDDGSRYRLGVDERSLLVWATGPFDVPLAARGELTARYDDYRRAGGLLLPFRTTYTLDGRPLAVERTVHLCPNEPALVPASFETPDRLPSCDTP